jgi:uncharacterized membrane protein YeaQ/YmgE (transglycosylase-associated protein family)
MSYEWMLFGAIIGVIGAVTNGDETAGLIYSGASGAVVVALLILAFGKPVGDAVFLYASAALVAPYVIAKAKRVGKSLLERL